MIRLFFYCLISTIIQTASSVYGLFLGNYIVNGNIFPLIPKKQLIKITVLLVFLEIIATSILVLLETPWWVFPLF